MSHLYPHLRVLQVFGASTDVGKTILTTALIRASATTPYPDRLNFGQHGDASKGRGEGDGPPERVFYLKPVNTGPLGDADHGHLLRHLPPHLHAHLHARTIYRFPDPVSPHLAPSLAKRAAEASPEGGEAPTAPTDVEFVRAVGAHIRWAASETANASSDARGGPVGEGRRRGALFVESAGGVHSPTLSGASQVDVYRPLRLPTILIGSPHLGGISTTVSAYESLLLRGYDVDAVLLFSRPAYYGNSDYLRGYFADRGVACWGVGRGPPEREGTEEEDRMRMKDYYQGLLDGRWQGGEQDEGVPMSDVVNHLRKRHVDRLAALGTMARRTLDTVWWPFTQHGLYPREQDVDVIDSAYGDFLETYRPPTPSEGSSDATSPSASTSASASPPPLVPSLLHPLFDASASWWTQCLGHHNPRLILAAARAAGRYGHVIFPTATNEPALTLAERLVHRQGSQAARVGQGWASRAFFSDDGSTGMEVALKMAIKSSSQRYGLPFSTRAAPGRRPGGMGGRTWADGDEWGILGLKGAYHGDTIGSMDAAEPNVYNQEVDWYKGRGYWLDPPSVKVQDGVPTVTAREGDWTDVKISRDAVAGGDDGGELFQDGRGFTKRYDSLADVYDVPARLRSDPLARVYRTHLTTVIERLTHVERRRFGALVIEPICVGAGGMIFVDPLFQRILVDVVRENEHLFCLPDPPLRPGKGAVSSSSLSGEEKVPQRTRMGSEWRGLPVIFDEVFTGLHRLGPLTPTSLLRTTPDISVLAKILTGGLVPMSITLASDSVFQTFMGEKKSHALLHGHSYTACPLSSSVANETLDILSSMRASGYWDEEKVDWGALEPRGAANQSLSSSPTSPPPSQALPSPVPSSGVHAESVAEGAAVRSQGGQEEERVWSMWKKDFVDEVSRHPSVEGSMTLGTVLVLYLRDVEGAGYQSTAATTLLSHLRHASLSKAESPDGAASPTGVPFNLHCRPLGNVVYFMSSLNTPRQVLREVEDAIRQGLEAYVRR